VYLPRLWTLCHAGALRPAGQVAAGRWACIERWQCPQPEPVTCLVLLACAGAVLLLLLLLLLLLMSLLPLLLLL